MFNMKDHDSGRDAAALSLKNAVEAAQGGGDSTETISDVIKEMLDAIDESRSATPGYAVGYLSVIALMAVNQAGTLINVGEAAYDEFVVQIGRPPCDDEEGDRRRSCMAFPGGNTIAA